MTGQMPAQSASVLAEQGEKQLEARGRYIRFAGIVRLLLGIITGASVFYLQYLGLVDLPVAFTIFVFLVGSFASVIHVPLYRRFPEHFHTLVMIFLLVDFAGLVVIKFLIGGPFALFILPLFLIGVFFVGVVGRPFDSIVLGGVTVLMIFAIEFFAPELYALPSEVDPSGMTLGRLYTGAATGFTAALTLLAYLLFRVMDRQQRQLEEQGVALGAINRQLVTSNKELEAANRYKSQFLSTISHELRTPLNSILGFSGMLLKGIEGPLTGGQEEDIQSINKSGKYLLALVNDLLDLARIEAGELNLDHDRVDVCGLAIEAVELLKPDYARKNLAVSVDLPPDGGAEVLGDRRRIEQIIINLLSNAIKFTEKGGVRIQVSVADDHVQVDVRDSGIGIPPEEREFVFDSFKQARRQGEARPKGAGLGLSIARQLVELHGGDIWVQSDVGQGSTFSFKIPRAISS